MFPFGVQTRACSYASWPAANGRRSSSVASESRAAPEQLENAPISAPERKRPFEWPPSAAAWAVVAPDGRADDGQRARCRIPAAACNHTPSQLIDGLNLSSHNDGHHQPNCAASAQRALSSFSRAQLPVGERANLYQFPLANPMNGRSLASRAQLERIGRAH